MLRFNLTAFSSSFAEKNSHKLFSLMSYITATAGHPFPYGSSESPSPQNHLNDFHFFVHTKKAANLSNVAELSGAAAC